MVFGRILFNALSVASKPSRDAIAKLVGSSVKTIETKSMPSAMKIADKVLTSPGANKAIIAFDMLKRTAQFAYKGAAYIRDSYVLCPYAMHNRLDLDQGFSVEELDTLIAIVKKGRDESLINGINWKGNTIIAKHAGKEGIKLLGIFIGVGLQALEDSKRDDLRPGQKIGRGFLSVLTSLPVVSQVDFAAQILYGPEKVDRMKTDFFSTKNPIVDYYGELIYHAFDSEAFTNWSSKRSWLDEF